MVPRDDIERLFSYGLLVDESNPLSVARSWLRRSLPTFLGCPEGNQGTAQVCIIGMPSDSMSDTGAGAATGPAAIRLASSFPPYDVDADSGRPLGWYDYYSNTHVLEGVTFADLGDVPINVGEPAAMCGKRVTKAVGFCRALNAFPLVIGGDHSLTAWALAAFAEQPISVLHLDAHSDLGALAGDSTPTNGSVARAILEQLNIQHFLSVGVRGFLPVEQAALAAGHHIISAREVRTTHADEIVARLPEDIPCYVTLDIDVLDPSIAPGTNAPVPDGLSFEEVRSILDAVGRTRQVVGADVVEVNPDRDQNLRTARAAAHLALSLLGASLKQTVDSPA
jgi:agmatinase